MRTNQAGVTLTEILIALFLSGLLANVLLQLYLNCKLQYDALQIKFSKEFDLLWISNLLRDSVRQAGFTPCRNIDALNITDRRGVHTKIQSIKLAPQTLSIQRMSSEFTQILSIKNLNQLIVSKFYSIKENDSVLISNCFHGEIHRVMQVKNIPQGQLITLINTILVTPDLIYLGEWIDEQWKIRNNPLGQKALYYRWKKSEEISAVINQLDLNEFVNDTNHGLQMKLGVANQQPRELIIGLRNR